MRSPGGNGNTGESMAGEIKPALSPYEWACHLHPSCSSPRNHEPLFGLIDTPQLQHRIAALALYGQPFGFTRADVELLWDAANTDDVAHLGGGQSYRSPLHDLAARVEALLPPLTDRTG